MKLFLFVLGIVLFIINLAFFIYNALFSPPHLVMALVNLVGVAFSVSIVVNSIRD